MRFNTLRFFSCVALMALAVSADCRESSVEQLPVGDVVVLEDAEASRVQQLLSHAPQYSRPAPRVWSSRFDVRWSARWNSAPRFAA